MEKKLSLKFGFANDTKIYVSENLTLYNQRLTWK